MIRIIAISLNSVIVCGENTRGGSARCPRTKLLAGSVERIKAHTDPAGGVKIVAIPRDGWRLSFQQTWNGAGDGRFPRGATYLAIEVRYRLIEEQVSYTWAV
jgi:hypothetical protein